MAELVISTGAPVIQLLKRPAGLLSATKLWRDKIGDEQFALPTDANIKLVNDLLVRPLISAGAWDLADCIPLYATDAVTGNVGRVNLVKPSDPLGSYVNAIIYNRKQGVKGDGVSAYVDTAFNPSSYSGRKYLPESNTNGVWVYSAATGSGSNAVTAGYAESSTYRLLNTSTAQHRVHSGNTGTANLSGTGWEVGYKTGAGAVTLVNGTTTALAATGLVDSVIIDANRVLFRSTTANYSDAGVSILIMGANMVSVNNAINTAITNYMNALASLP